MKKIGCLCGTVLVCAILLLSGCASGRPEVTGVADDGLFLYSGNLRLTSDWQNAEPLVTAVRTENGSVPVEVRTCEYDGATVFLTADGPDGWFLLQYDCAARLTEVLFRGSGSAPLEIVCREGSRFVLRDERGFRYIRDGVCAGQLELGGGSARDYAFAGGYILHAEGRALSVAPWGGERRTLELGEEITALESRAGTVFVSTRTRYATEREFDYFCRGLFAFDPARDRLAVLGRSAEGQNLRLEPETGFFVRGTWNAAAGAATDYALFRFDPSSFSEERVCDFPHAGADLATNGISLCGGLLEMQYRPSADEPVEIPVTFDPESGQFSEREPNAPTVLAEFGDYWFYGTFHPTGFLTGEGYAALHRVNRVSGADEVMAVLFCEPGSANAFDIDLVLNC